MQMTETIIKLSLADSEPWYLIISAQNKLDYALANVYMLDEISDKIITQELFQQIWRLAAKTGVIKLVGIVTNLTDSKLTELPQSAVELIPGLGKMNILAQPKQLENILQLFNMQVLDLPKLAGLTLKHQFRLLNADYQLKSLNELYRPLNKTLYLKLLFQLDGMAVECLCSRALLSKICRSLLNTTTLEQANDEFYSLMLADLAESYLKLSFPKVNISIKAVRFSYTAEGYFFRVDIFDAKQLLCGHLLLKSYDWLKQYPGLCLVPEVAAETVAQQQSLVDLSFRTDFMLSVGETRLTASELNSLQKDDIVLLDNFIKNSDEIVNLKLDMGGISYLAEVKDKKLLIGERL